MPRTSAPLASLAWSALLVGSCGGDADDSSAASPGDAAACGDIDGPGGDTGDIPAILGSWNVSFGEERYSAIDCNFEGLTADDLEFLDGAMTIDGRVPDQLYAEFTEDDTRYWGLQSAYGGVVFSGQREYRGYTLHVTFGGHVFENPVVENQSEIRGFAYVGVDGDQNNTIDCWLQGTFRAIGSGN